MFTSRIAGLMRLTYIVVIICMMTGCAGTGKKQRNGIDAQLGDIEADRELSAMQEAMKRFIDDLESETRNSANSIERNTHDVSVRKAAMLWKVEVLQLANDVDHDQDPRINLLNSYMFTVRLLDYFTTGEGKDLFGDQQPIAVETARHLEAEVESVVREYFPAHRLSELHRDVKQKARESPIRGLFQFNDRGFYSDESAAGEGVLSWLVGSPWRAFRSGREALDPTSSLAQSVDRFTTLMDDYPSLMRLQTQLLWLQLEESASIKKTVNGIDGLSKSSIRLASVAEDLPTRVREELRLAWDDAAAHQPALHETLDKTQATAETLRETLATAETVSAGIERSLGEMKQVGEIWQETAGAVTQTVKQFQQFGKPKQRTTDGTPDLPKKKFDVKEYTQAAEVLSASAVEVRALLAELRGFVDGDSMERVKDQADELTTATLGQTSTELRGVIDHLSWRMVQICLLVLVLAICYRLIARGPLRTRT